MNPSNTKKEVQTSPKGDAEKNMYREPGTQLLLPLFRYFLPLEPVPDNIEMLTAEFKGKASMDEVKFADLPLPSPNAGDYDPIRDYWLQREGRTP
jgi:hypothetical protein